MLRPFGTGLPSDAIAHRYGYEGNEPRALERLHAIYASSGVRSTFAVNTFYDEVVGGYYVNCALFALIGSAMRSVEVLPVVWDAWRSEGMVPIEGEGHFLVPDEYVLVAPHQSQIGVLQTWQFQTGGGGAYYSHNIIFDMILPEDVTHRLVNAVEDRCKIGAVRFDRAPHAVHCEQRSWTLRTLARFLSHFR